MSCGCRIKQNKCPKRCYGIASSDGLNAIRITDGTTSEELTGNADILFTGSSPVKVEVKAPKNVHVSLLPGLPGDVLTTDSNGFVKWGAPGSATAANLTDNEDGTYLFNNGYGQQVTIVAGGNSSTFNPGNSGLNATTYNAAIIEVNSKLHDPTTIISSNGSLTVSNVNNNSQEYDISLNVPSVLSIDAGNAATVGTDGKIFVANNVGENNGTTSTLTKNANNTYTHNNGAGNLTVIEIESYDNFTMSWQEGTFSSNTQYTPDFGSITLPDIDKSSLFSIANPNKGFGEVISAQLYINRAVTVAGTLKVEKIDSNSNIVTIATFNIDVSASTSRSINATIPANSIVADGDRIRYNVEGIIQADNISANMVLNYKEA